MIQAWSFPERAAIIRRAVARLCLRLDWAPLHEVPLANGRRADILALRRDGGFVCIEIKSGPRDFQTDRKWPEYREFSDLFYFAVDADFPLSILPETEGLMIVSDYQAELARESPEIALSSPRRAALLRRWARLAGGRLALLEDPAALADVRGGLLVE